jgi:ABC-type transport system involved in Fe-S cluster assembly fused permease/ATPase subunit
VPQDAFLFSDSIKNNIMFGKENATSQEVEAAKVPLFMIILWASTNSMKRF